MCVRLILLKLINCFSLPKVKILKQLMLILWVSGYIFPDIQPPSLDFWMKALQAIYMIIYLIDFQQMYEIIGCSTTCFFCRQDSGGWKNLPKEEPQRGPIWIGWKVFQVPTDELSHSDRAINASCRQVRWHRKVGGIFVRLEKAIRPECHR